MTIRVAIIDDQELVRMGLRMVLDSSSDTHGAADIEVVGGAADGTDALDVVARCNPDVVLMDVRTPIVDGIEATRLLTSTYPDIKVVVLTTFDLDDYAFAAIRAGASGFLLKDVRGEELCACVRSAYRGNAVLTSRVTRALMDSYLTNSPSLPTTVEPIPALSDREEEVLAAIAAGMSNREIAQALFISETTAKTHVGNILTKLNARSRIHAVIFAYESGRVGRNH